MSLHAELSALYSGSLIRVSPNLYLPEGFKKLFPGLCYVNSLAMNYVVDVALKRMLNQEIDMTLDCHTYLDMWDIIQKVDPEPMLSFFLSEFISSGFTNAYISLIKHSYFTISRNEIDVVKIILNTDKLMTFLVYNPDCMKHCQSDILGLFVNKISINIDHNNWEHNSGINNKEVLTSTWSRSNQII